MVNRNKAIGDRWESAVRDYLRSNGIKGYRIRQEGREDRGDIGGLELFAVEAKNHKSPNFHDFVRQAKQEAQNDNKPFGVAIVKKRGASAKEGLVVMDLETFAKLVIFIEVLRERNNNG